MGILSRGGTGKQATTTNLIRHAEKKHPTEYAEIFGPLK